jgi:hypothetical protein
MGKTFRGNERTRNLEKYQKRKEERRKKDKLAPKRERNDWRRNDTDSYEYDDVPNYYDMNIR